jgi:flagellar hook-length control protein FliK
VDSGVTLQADSLTTGPGLPNPSAPGDATAPGRIAPENIKPSAGSSAAAPAGVAGGKNAPAPAKPSPPATPDSSGDSRHLSSPASFTPESASASGEQAQHPAAAAGHADQPAAAIAAQPIPLADSRQGPPHNGNDHGTGNNGNPPQADAGNIPQPADRAAPVLVQSARILERMGQTEMRVGVNTADFGNLELRASVSQNQVGASIATAHGELRAAMLAEMPSLERSMEHHQLRLEHLDLGAHNGGANSGHQKGDGFAQQQPRSQPGSEAGFTAISSSSGDAVPSPGAPAPSSGSAPYSSGLNVHA